MLRRLLEANICLHGISLNVLLVFDFQEDYINKLQTKLKSYKAKLVEKIHLEDSSADESRRVLFEDDMERQAVKRLKAELEVKYQTNNTVTRLCVSRLQYLYGVWSTCACKLQLRTGSIGHVQYFGIY